MTQYVYLIVSKHDISDKLNVLDISNIKYEKVLEKIFFVTYFFLKLT